MVVLKYYSYTRPINETVLEELEGTELTEKTESTIQQIETTEKQKQKQKEQEQEKQKEDKQKEITDISIPKLEPQLEKKTLPPPGFKKVVYERGLSYTYLPISSKLDHLVHKSTNLPTIPSCIQVQAKFPKLKRFRHPNLCEQVELLTSKTGKLYLIQEHFPNSLLEILKEGNLKFQSVFGLAKFSVQVLEALSYVTDKSLAGNRLVAVGNLTPQTILLPQVKGTPFELHKCLVKVSSFGLFYLNEYAQRHFDWGGDGVYYSAPELLLSLGSNWWISNWKPGEGEIDKFNRCSYVEDLSLEPVPLDGRVDLWSLGVVLVEMVTGTNCIRQFVDGLTVEDQLLERTTTLLQIYFLKLMQLVTNWEVREQFLQCIRRNLVESWPGLDREVEPFVEFVLLCIQPKLDQRLFPEQLRVHRFLSRFPPNAQSVDWYCGLPSAPQRTTDQLQKLVTGPMELESWFDKLTLPDLVTLYQISNADIESEPSYLNPTQPTPRPSIHDLPFAVLRSSVNEVRGTPLKFQANLPSRGTVGPVDLQPYPIDLNPLKVVIQVAQDSATWFQSPSITPVHCHSIHQLPKLLFPTASSPSHPKHRFQPPLRNDDVLTHCQRLYLFRTLLQQYPSSRQELLYHAQHHLPPSLRGWIWAAALEVVGDYRSFYYATEVQVSQATRHQISLDVPRCHQYHPRLCTGYGQGQLTRLLTTWVTWNSDLVYWQGLDSLAATCLLATPDDPALAYQLLQRVVGKFLSRHFTSENSQVLQAQLCHLHTLLLFHHPRVAVHLESIGFQLHFFAIPWFLTLFSRTFLMDQVLVLWDRLLLGPQVLPVLLAVSILHGLEKGLLHLDFNHCSQLFSDPPLPLDGEELMDHAFTLLHKTPESLRTPNQNVGLETPIDGSTLGSWQFEGKILKVPQLHGKDLANLPHPITFLDLRSSAEFFQSHPPHAVHISLDWGLKEEPNLELNRLIGYLGTQPTQLSLVVGEDDFKVSSFALLLVKAGLPRVATLTTDRYKKWLQNIPHGFNLTLCTCSPIPICNLAKGLKGVGMKEEDKFLRGKGQPRLGWKKVEMFRCTKEKVLQTGN